MDGPTDVVEHAAQHVVVRVPHPHVGVGPVTGLHRLRRRPRVGQVGVDHPLAQAGLRLVHTASAERATAVILTGISLGTVCGVPAGALVGDAFGWRMAFILTAVLSGVVLLVQITCLPRLPALRVVRKAGTDAAIYTLSGRWVGGRVQALGAWA